MGGCWQRVCPGLRVSDNPPSQTNAILRIEFRLLTAGRSSVLRAPLETLAKTVRTTPRRRRSCWRPTSRPRPAARSSPWRSPPSPTNPANKIAKHFSENHLCGAKELFASPRKIFRIPSPLYIETLRKSAENPVFSARVPFFCPRLRFFTQDRPFCMARELILATIDD